MSYYHEEPKLLRFFLPAAVGSISMYIVAVLSREDSHMQLWQNHRHGAHKFPLCPPRHRRRSELLGHSCLWSLFEKADL
jgi:hypothetical protein